MTVISVQSKIYKSLSIFGSYSVKAQVKTDGGFQDSHTFYFPSRKEAKQFIKDNTTKETKVKLVK